MKIYASIFFVILIFLQSCRVYHAKPVPIDDAVLSKKRVKIYMTDGKKLKFKKIVQDSNQFFGLNKIKGNMEKTPLNIDTIKRIRLHNRPLSIILGIASTLGVAGIVSFVIAIAEWSIDVSGPISAPN